MKSLFLLDTGEKAETQIGINSRLNLGCEPGTFGLRPCSPNIVHQFSKAKQSHYSAVGEMVAFLIK